jgi:hypothetical protein
MATRRPSMNIDPASRGTNSDTALPGATVTSNLSWGFSTEGMDEASNWAIRDFEGWISVLSAVETA